MQGRCPGERHSGVREGQHAGRTTPCASRGRDITRLLWLVAVEEEGEEGKWLGRGVVEAGHVGSGRRAALVVGGEGGDGQIPQDPALGGAVHGRQR